MCTHSISFSYNLFFLFVGIVVHVLYLSAAFSPFFHFKGSFEFRSVLYASMGSLFFDEVARTLAQSFVARCSDLYGPDHLVDSKTQRHSSSDSRTS